MDTLYNIFVYTIIILAAFGLFILIIGAIVLAIIEYIEKQHTYCSNCDEVTYHKDDMCHKCGQVNPLNFNRITNEN